MGPAHRLAVLGLGVAVLILAGCGGGPAAKPHHRAVVVVDRTGVARTHTWRQEVAAVAATATRSWITEGVASVDIVGAGATINDTARAADISLRSSCNNARRCDEAHQRVASEVGTIAAGLAAVPVTQNGTDLINALSTARTICGSSNCIVLLITDGMDSRLVASTDVNTLVAKTLPLVPDLSGVTVELAGLGADGSNSAAVERAKTFWTELLTKRRAIGVRIGRSI